MWMLHKNGWGLAQTLLHRGMFMLQLLGQGPTIKSLGQCA